MHNLQINISSPLGLLFQESSHMVLLPALDGEMGILYNHVPTIASLAFGLIKLLDEESNLLNSFYIDGGVVQINSSGVEILCYQCYEDKSVDINYILNKIALLKKIATKPSKLLFYEKVLAVMQA